MALTKIASTAASSSSAIAFTSDINSTYKLYMFKFIEIHPSGNEYLTWQGSTDGGSNYNVSILSSAFRSINKEAADDYKIEYRTAADQNGTGYQWLTETIKNDADANGSGFLVLFNPSNTTYVKHFCSPSNCLESSDYSQQLFIGGFFNTTSAINAVNFKMNSGTIDAGTIEMWGL